MAGSSARQVAQVRGRTRERAPVWLRLGLCLLLAACSVGHGVGEITGTVSVPGCRDEGSYSLDPSSFFAQAFEQLLSVRIQRGSDLEIKSDGLAILVQDATLVRRKYLGKELKLGAGASPEINATVYLSESCPPGRTDTPVVLAAVSGTIRFDEIYAPEVSKSEVAIRGELSNARFEDPNDPERWAELSGNFDFLYVRGSPSQRFP